MIDIKNKSKIARTIISNREGGVGVKDAMLRRVEIDVLESKNSGLRQQLADVSHERDLLRAAADKMARCLQYIIVRKGLSVSGIRLIAKKTINGAFVPESKS